MSAKSRDFWAAALAGLVVGGLLEVPLSLIDLGLLSIAIPPFIGGVVAAYLLHGKIVQGAAAGALSGVLGTLFSLGVSQVLFIFEVIPGPSGPTPPLSVLQALVAVIFMIDLVAGIAGGTLIGVVRRPRPGAGLPPPPPPGAPPSVIRYCVQCGAQLPPGAVVCPHCNARQPQ
jgi:hypothetical protein